MVNIQQSLRPRVIFVVCMIAHVSVYYLCKDLWFVETIHCDTYSRNKLAHTYRYRQQRTAYYMLVTMRLLMIFLRASKQ